MKYKAFFVILVFAAAAAGLVLTGCSTAPTTVESREVTMTRQEGTRVSEAEFDTNFSRVEYVILGTVSGEGTVVRKVVTVGEKEEPKQSPFQRGSSKKPAYRKFFVLEYDRSYGTWEDEGNISIDAIGDNEMSEYDEFFLQHMETIAARIALYNALNEMPEADAILMPRYEFSYIVKDKLTENEEVIAREVTSVTARMRGKAIKIKSDEELYQTYEQYPALLGGE